MLGEGEVIFHFVQSGQGVVADLPADLLDVDFDDEADVNDVPEAQSRATAATSTGTSQSRSDGEVTVVTANSNLDGGELRISHICIGEERKRRRPRYVRPRPVLRRQRRAERHPPTDTFGGNGTSSPADSAWLLVVALGVLLASIVVLTPARAKSRR